MKLDIREMQARDIDKIVDYFVDADIEFLKQMGADKAKLPEREKWIEKLKLELQKNYQEKEFYYIIWMINGESIGHSNINTIEFGKSATMHLHLWNGNERKKGFGLELLKRSLPYYFKNFELKKLICEVYTENIAPNKVLTKLGFNWVKTYETTPGWINFHQTVNRYELTYKRLEKIIRAE